MNQPQEPMTPRERQAHRAALRKKKMMRRRRQQQLAVLAGLAVLVILLIVLLVKCAGNSAPVDTTPVTTDSAAESTYALQEITWMTIPEDRALTAKQYFVYDCNSGNFLTIAETPGTRIYPASITKLTTAYVAMQYLQPDDVLAVGDALNLVAAGSSVAELEKGDTLTASQLIGGMILPSGNDAAYVLATEAGRIILEDPSADAKAAVKAFVEKMNLHAQQTGLADTHFANPDGIHKEDHYTTYQDLVTMAQQALQNKSLMEYCATGNATVHTGDRELQWHNTNLLVDPESEFYCPIAVGLKTGQTPYAGSCLLSAFVTENTTLIIGVFGCPDIESRFLDTLQLLNETLSPVY